MNNEMNNNVNNTGNPSGMNFVQGGTPAGAPPVQQPQQPVYQMPAQPQVAPAPAAEMPAAVNMAAPVAPQPVNPQPIEAAPVNFVANAPASAPMPAQGVVNSAPVPPVAPPVEPQMPGVPPVAAAPMMQQPQPNMGPMPGPMMPNGMPNAVPPMQNNANPAPQPEGEKEKLPIVMIIITVLVVAGVTVFLIMYLTGKISFGKKNNNNNNNNPTVVEEPTNTVVLADWMNYILEQKPTEIKINRYIDADNTKSVNINEDALKNLFTKMKDYKLVKYYSTTRSVANDDLQITYIKDSVNYNFTISGENITIGDDSNLKTLFENSATDIEDDGQTSRDSEDYNYILKNFDEKIYDEYFTEGETE